MGVWRYSVDGAGALPASLHNPFDRQGRIAERLKLRELFVRPHALERGFFYGLNFEFSVNYLYWEPRHITSELRPIIGTHFHHFDLIYNSIVDTEYRGGLGGLEFVPAGRVAYNLSNGWTVAAEEYADFGTFKNILKTNEQLHEVWGVVDRDTKYVDIETGFGVGVTAGADKLTFKLMFSRDLN